MTARPGQRPVPEYSGHRGGKKRPHPPERPADQMVPGGLVRLEHHPTVDRLRYYLAQRSGQTGGLGAADSHQDGATRVGGDEQASGALVKAKKERRVIPTRPTNALGVDPPIRSDSVRRAVGEQLEGGMATGPCYGGGGADDALSRSGRAPFHPPPVQQSTDGFGLHQAPYRLPVQSRRKPVGSYDQGRIRPRGRHRRRPHHGLPAEFPQPLPLGDREGFPPVEGVNGSRGELTYPKPTADAMAEAGGEGGIASSLERDVGVEANQSGMSHQVVTGADGVPNQFGQGVRGAAPLPAVGIVDPDPRHRGRGERSGGMSRSGARALGASAGVQRVTPRFEGASDRPRGSPRARSPSPPDRPGRGGASARAPPPQRPARVWDDA